MSLTNAQIADLLYGAAARFTEQKARALRRAARYALVWEEEAVTLVESGRSLTELDAVGPWVARAIHELLEEPPVDQEPDPLRAGFITLSGAQEAIASDPAWEEDLQGDLQMHSIYSDGTLSIGEMAAACVALGYSYMAITDHSKGLKIAGGIDEVTLRAQAREVANVNEDLVTAGADFRVLHSIELNLDMEGAGDMEPGALAELDIVVGSFHSKLRRKEDQTARVMGAVANPNVQVIGHPTGRMYGIRHGVLAEWERAFTEGAARGKAFEINAQPNRQDLSVPLLERARDAGVMLSIGTDAHSAGELLNVDLSLGAAALAGISRDRIINYLTLDELQAWVAESRERAGRR